MKKKILLLFTVLLMAAAGLTACDSSGRISQLCDAIEAGDNEEAKQIASGIRNLNAESEPLPRLAELCEGTVWTPLNAACWYGNGEMVVWLLEHGADANYAPGRQEYPLEMFCDAGCSAGPEALDSLLEHGADPKLYKYRAIPYLPAQFLEHRSDEKYPEGVSMILKMINAGASWTDSAMGDTILHFAAVQRDGSLLRPLLEKAEAAEYLYMENNKGELPIDWAEIRGSDECVQLLKEAMN